MAVLTVAVLVAVFVVDARRLGHERLLHTLHEPEPDVLDVRHRLIQQVGHVRVVQRVDDPPALPLPTTSSRCRSSRNWCETADCSIPTASASSPTEHDDSRSRPDPDPARRRQRLHRLRDETRRGGIRSAANAQTPSPCGPSRVRPIQFTADLIKDDGEVTNAGTEDFLRSLMVEYEQFISRVSTVLPRPS